jgi:cysteinyl-tRNA synthetase
MAIRIYNTLTRQKEEFKPVKDGEVKIYLCGPTVYKKSHIGHSVGPVIFDAIRRWLTAVHRYKVTLAVNITDVEDKLIDEARRQGRPMQEIAEEVTADYLAALEALNVQPPDIMPKATEHIAEIIAIVKTLIDRGVAYQLDGDVYFDVTKFSDYGKLSGQRLEEQTEGTRDLRSAQQKRHPGDFVLWKSAKEGELAWDSPWGPGRPGWHIECSAMSMKYLGETFDIHGGGLDLVFPHHENEIAQSEAATGKPFVKYWLHHGLTRVDARKMSKSLGNIRAIGELLQEYPGEVIRFFILSTHYRRPIDFSDEQIENVARGMQAFYRLFDRCRQISGKDPYAGDKLLDGPIGAEGTSKELLDTVAQFDRKFAEAMDDDFNTAEAIANLYEMANAANRYIEQTQLSSGSPHKDMLPLLAAVDTLLKDARLLGLFERPPAKAISDDLTESLVALLIDVRAEARKGKHFALADMVRDRLAALGIQLKDSREGTGWEKAG